MTTATMIKQLRIFEIIIICILVKSLYGKSFNKKLNQANVLIDERRVKRGYSHYGGNDFGSSLHVTSGVLQYSGDDKHSISSDSAINVEHSSILDGSLNLSSVNADHFGSLGSSNHFQPSASNADPWSPSTLSSGYDVWLEPLDDSHAASDLGSAGIHTSSIASTHPVDNHIVNTVFSDNTAHLAHIELPRSQLNTKIASSSIGKSAVAIDSSIHGHGISTISDNIDFNNVADLNTKHYVKSYGK